MKIFQVEKFSCCLINGWSRLSTQLDGLIVHIPNSYSDKRSSFVTLIEECGGRVAGEVRRSHFVLLFPGWIPNELILKMWNKLNWRHLKGKRWIRQIRHPINPINFKRIPAEADLPTKLELVNNYKSRPLEFVALFWMVNRDSDLERDFLRLGFGEYNYINYD